MPLGFLAATTHVFVMHYIIFFRNTLGRRHIEQYPQPYRTVSNFFLNLSKPLGLRTQTENTPEGGKHGSHGAKSIPNPT